MEKEIVQSLNIRCPKCGGSNLRMMSVIVFDPLTAERSMVTTCGVDVTESRVMLRNQLVEPASGWGLIVRMICSGPDGCGEKPVLELGHSESNGVVLEVGENNPKSARAVHTIRVHTLRAREARATICR